jgi:hypothetical protein
MEWSLRERSTELCGESPLPLRLQHLISGSPPAPAPPILTNQTAILQRIGLLLTLSGRPGSLR